MSIGLMAAGIFSAQGILGYQADKDQSKAQRVWQQYSNTMTDLSNAAMQNAITQNEIFAQEASTDVASDIQVDLLQAEGAAAVAAASAGIKGVSVRQAKFDLYRSASIAEGRRTRSLSNRFLAFDQQRDSAVMTAEMRKNHSFIPKPSASSYILGTAGKIFGALSTPTPTPSAVKK